MPAARGNASTSCSRRCSCLAPTATATRTSSRGGQRQRASLARSLALEPELLIADEPTSALDVSVQARVLELFAELQREFGFASLFISHDLAVVDLLADRIAVLYRGELVEEGTGVEVLGAPADPYTQRLLASLPVPDPVAQAERARAAPPVPRGRLMARRRARLPDRAERPVARVPAARRRARHTSRCTG